MFRSLFMFIRDSTYSLHCIFVSVMIIYSDIMTKYNSILLKRILATLYDRFYAQLDQPQKVCFEINAV